MFCTGGMYKSIDIQLLTKKKPGTMVDFGKFFQTCQLNELHHLCGEAGKTLSLLLPVLSRVGGPGYLRSLLHNLGYFLLLGLCSWWGVVEDLHWSLRGGGTLSGRYKAN